jgi:N-acyl amino acid synthase of PEP-CTERM/exosortase system
MFDKYFEVFVADTPEGKEINYQIRYQVYCLETGYENPSKFPDKWETDEFDQRSIHFIAKAHATEEWIAAMRLVVGSLSELPISTFGTIDIEQLLKLMRAKSIDDFVLSAEVSRMSVISQYRRRSLERNVPFQVPWNTDEEPTVGGENLAAERRKAPWLMLALLYAARDYSEQHGIRHWFFLAANSLARIFKGLGMQLEQTGSGCEHRGLRFPYVIKIPSGFDNFEFKYPRLAQTIPDGIRYRYFSELTKEHYKIPVVI